MARRHLRMVMGGPLLPVVAVCVLISSRQALAQGQGATATLTGQVNDQSGAAIPKVELTLTSTAGGQPLTTDTNEAGYYRFSFVRPDTYTLTAAVKGFGDVRIPKIALQVNQTSNVDVTMKPGTVVQQVTVSAAAVALETQSSSLGSVIGEQVNQQLPLILRDPTELVNLVPGVTSDHRMTTAADSSGLSYQGRLDFEINGGFRSQAVAMVDGVDVTVIAGSFSSAPIIPTPDFTQEFKVQTNNLGPEFGRGTGVLNIVTKSGTNQLRGSVFEFLQNNHLNSQDLFSNRAGQQKAQAKRNQYGVALGGPVYLPHAYDGRNKTFWFFNLEQLRQRRALPVSLRVPNTAEVSGNFSGDYALSGQPITIYNPFDTYVDPATGKTLRRPFPSNKVPSALFTDPAFAAKVLGYYPSPNNAGVLGTGGVFTGIGNYQLAGSAPLDWNRYDVKVDHNIGSSHRLMGRYSQTYYRVTPLDVFHNAASSQAYSTRDNAQPGHNVVLSWTWVASPTTVVTQAVNWSRFIDDSNQPKFDPTQLGGPFASGAIDSYLNQYAGGGAFPNFTLGGYAAMGNGFGNNFKEPYSNYGYSAGINHTHGKHTLKFGFQFQLLQAADNLFKGYGGTFNFPGSWTCGPDPLNCSPLTGNGLADFELGLVTSGSMNAAFSSLYTSHYFGGYVQDDFRVTPRLTLNLGMRYEVTTPFTERFNHEFRFDPNRLNPIGADTGPNTNGSTLNQVLSGLGNKPLQGVVEFPSSPGVEGRGMVPTDYSNWSPRLGLAYQIRPKLVFRAGFSKLYMLSPAAPGPSTPGNGTFGAATNITATINGITPILNIDNPFPAGFNVPTYDRLGLNSLLGTGVTAGATGQVTPFQYQMNAGFEYELPGNSLIGVAYAGSRGHRLTCAFFFCGDQIPRNLVQKYGSSVFKTVPNPFYGIITDPTAALSQPSVQLGQLLKQWPAYTNWTAVLPPWQGPDPNHDTFQSSFDALEVQFNKRFSQGLTVIAAYTFSKLLTNSDSFEAGYLGPASGYQNTVDYSGEWSLSAADVSHRLVLGHVYDLPFGRGRPLASNLPSVLDKVVGHWQFAGITTFQSGFPLSVGEAGHTTGAFGGGDRPNQVPGASPCLDMGRSRGAKILDYLNPAAFARPADYSFGNAPRLLNGCRADGQKNFDLSLIKFIPIKESFNAEFRAEFFNAFNRPQLGSPNTTFNGGSFGVITSQANAPRIIQFGLKLNF